MKKKSGYALLIVFIFLVGLAALTSSFLFLTSGGIKKVTQDQHSLQALYVAEAGLHKALWYIRTPVDQGGLGTSWRTSGTTESFANGFYTISVSDFSLNEIQVISTGEVGSTQRALGVILVLGGGLPPAFNYAIFSDGALTLNGNCEINGSTYVDNNLTLKGNITGTNGTATVSPGYTITRRGNINYPEGVPPNPLPTMPVIDTSSYDREINIAAGQTPQNRILTNYNLGDQTLYVNGTVTINGNVTGSGKIVSTGSITFSGNGQISGGVTFISNNQVVIRGNQTVTGNTYIYGTNLVDVRGNVGLTGRVAVLSPNSVKIGGNARVDGLIYGNNLQFVGNARMQGTIVGGSFGSGLSGNVTIIYDGDVIPPDIKGFGGTGTILIKPGSWKEF